MAARVAPAALQLLLGAGFIAMGAWALVPDKLDDQVRAGSGAGVFLATCLAFFLAEIGDKTQLATVALAARYAAIVPVVLGTTLGMLLANVPLMVAGDRLSGRLPLALLRRLAAALFVLLGALTLWSALATSA